MSSNAPFFVDNEVIVLTKYGVWLADGHEISHEPTRKLFARSLVKEAEGYFLKIGRESKKIQVEDTAYFIHRVDGDARHGYEVWVNDESREKLDPASLKYRPGRLVCRIKGGKEEARFLQAAYMEVLRDVEDDGECYFLSLQGLKVVLSGKVDS